MQSAQCSLHSCNHVDYGKYNLARRLDFDIVLFCQITCRIVELRQWYLDDMRRLYESGIDAEGEGQNETLHSNEVHDYEMYLRLVELIEWVVQTTCRLTICTLIVSNAIMMMNTGKSEYK